MVRTEPQRPKCLPRGLMMGLACLLRGRGNAGYCMRENRHWVYIHSGGWVLPTTHSTDEDTETHGLPNLPDAPQLHVRAGFPLQVSLLPKSLTVGKCTICICNRPKHRWDRPVNSLVFFLSLLVSSLIRVPFPTLNPIVGRSAAVRSPSAPRNPRLDPPVRFRATVWPRSDPTPSRDWQWTWHLLPSFFTSFLSCGSFVGQSGTRGIGSRRDEVLGTWHCHAALSANTGWRHFLWGCTSSSLTKACIFRLTSGNKLPHLPQPQVLLLVASYPLPNEVPKPQQATFSGGFVLDAWAWVPATRLQCIPQWAKRWKWRPVSLHPLLRLPFGVGPGDSNRLPAFQIFRIQQALDFSGYECFQGVGYSNEFVPRTLTPSFSWTRRRARTWASPLSKLLGPSSQGPLIPVTAAGREHPHPPAVWTAPC